MTEFRIKPFILIALAVLAVSYGVLVFDDDTVVALGTEDGLFECATSVLFAITGGLLAWMYVKCPYANDLLVLRTRRNIFFLLLALVFLFGAGEEISWGQRIFGFETPESIAKENLQGEMNIHNLSIFHQSEESGVAKTGWRKLLSIQGMFALFWIFYCFLVPLSCRLSSGLAGLLRRFGLPIVPLGIGIFFPINYGVSKLLEKTVTPHGMRIHWPAMEIKEAVFSALFLLMAVAYYRGMHSLSGTNAPAAPSS
jgi:hypothetical protein